MNEQVLSAAIAAAIAGLTTIVVTWLQSRRQAEGSRPQIFLPYGTVASARNRRALLVVGLTIASGLLGYFFLGRWTWPQHRSRYHADFSAPVKGWPLGERRTEQWVSSTSIDNGRFVWSIRGLAWSNVTLEPAVPIFSELEVDCEFVRLVGPTDIAHGVSLKSNPGDGAYSLAIRNDGVFSVDYASSSGVRQFVSWSESPAIHPSRNRLRMVAGHEHLEFFINESLVAAIDESGANYGRGSFFVAHCQAPRRMDGKNFEPASIQTHYESDYGAACKTHYAIGQVVTVVVPNLVCTKWRGFRGKIAATPSYPACRSQMDIRVDGDWKRLLREMEGFHAQVVYGDYMREVGYALKKLGGAIQWDSYSEPA